MPSMYAAQMLLVVNGLPIIYLRKLDYQVRTGRELVKGMSPTGKPIGHVNGTKEYTLDIEVYVPRTGDIPWASIENAVVAVTNREGGAPAVTFTGCFVIDEGVTTQETGAATRRISMGALNAIGLK